MIWSSPSPLQIHQKISTCVTTLTEHLLNTGRSPQTPKRARKSPSNWVRQKTKKKKKKRQRKKLGWELHLWEGDVKEERFPHTGKSPHQWGQRGSFGASEESTATSVLRAKQRDLHRAWVLTLTSQPEWLVHSPNGAGGG